MLFAHHWFFSSVSFLLMKIVGTRPIKTSFTYSICSVTFSEALCFHLQTVLHAILVTYGLKMEAVRFWNVLNDWSWWRRFSLPNPNYFHQKNNPRSTLHHKKESVLSVVNFFCVKRHSQFRLKILFTNCFQASSSRRETDRYRDRQITHRGYLSSTKSLAPSPS